MADGQWIDLVGQVRDIFKKEEMLAFFDFQCSIENTNIMEGLCKISKPKEGESKSKYFSLILIVDTPAENRWKDINLYCKNIDWEGLKYYLPNFINVVSIPTIMSNKSYYVKEADVFVNSLPANVSKFLENTLYPAILKVTGFKGGEFILFDNLQEHLSENQGEKQGFFDKLKNFFN